MVRLSIICLVVCVCSYRADFEALKEARASLGPLLQCVAEARNSMVEEFNRADEGGIILGRVSASAQQKQRQSTHVSSLSAGSVRAEAPQINLLQHISITSVLRC